MLCRLISEKFEKFKSDFIKEMDRVLFVCLTADIWTGRNRGFFGVTAHWLNEDLKRVGCAIVIQRFKGST